jgi:uroporphyrinogen decarboxylase
MSELTYGERLTRCLLGEEIDRVPFGVGVGWAPWSETHDRWVRESGNSDLNLYVYPGYEPSWTNPAMESGLFPLFETTIIEETDDIIVLRNLQGITLRTRRDGGSMPEFLDYPVKTPDDWDRLKAERLRIDVSARIPQNWDEFRSKIKETGEGVQVGHFPYGVFGAVRDLLGVEEMLVAFYTEPEMIRDMMNHLTSLWISLWERAASEVQIDHIHIWEDMSGKQGSLISPKMVEEFMMPCYDRIVDFARANGVRIVSVDTDGDCAELVPIFVRHGINMMFPFEVQAGNDILDYRRDYPELGIMDGLDKRALAHGKAEIDAEIAKAVEMVKLGRYIPGFDHLIPPDVPWDNFRYAAEEIKRLCCSG